MSASVAERVAQLPHAERRAVLADHDPKKLPYAWWFWARPAQLPPRGDWSTWVVLAGRGFGKSRSGAEWVRSVAERAYTARIALVAPTSADVRDVMVEGDSGILAISPPWFYPKYEPSKRRLTWPNGVIATTYTADKPERLRGPSHGAVWCDELAAWRYADAFDQLRFGLRLGEDPLTVVTTTPKPVKLLRDILKLKGVVVTGGSTYENRTNLAPAFFDTIIRRYEGTRLGRQELLAEILDDVVGALWTQTLIDDARVSKAPDLVRVVIPIDPAVSHGEDSSETGMVPVGKGVDGHFYVLGDRSCRLSAEGWATRAINSYDDFRADRIIGEVNNGGELVESVIKLVAQKSGKRYPYKAVHASRGKAIRAEPISALYEQGRVHHVGTFPELEQQMCSWVPGSGDDSPDRMDSLVWGLTELAGTGGPISRDEGLEALLGGARGWR